MAFERLDKLCRQVVSRMNTDELAGSYSSASPEEKPIEASAPTGVADTSAGGGAPIADEREEVTRRGHVPEMGKGRTRSSDGWTVRKPEKTTGTKPAAPDQGVNVNERSPRARPTLLLMVNNKCEPRRDPARLPRRGLGSHLVLVASAGHARSLSGAPT
jgi:hypothetical protein